MAINNHTHILYLCTILMSIFQIYLSIYLDIYLYSIKY